MLESTATNNLREEQLTQHLLEGGIVLTKSFDKDVDHSFPPKVAARPTAFLQPIDVPNNCLPLWICSGPTWYCKQQCNKPGFQQRKPKRYELSSQYHWAMCPQAWTCCSLCLSLHSYYDLDHTGKSCDVPALLQHTSSETFGLPADSLVHQEQPSVLFAKQSHCLSLLIQGQDK